MNSKLRYRVVAIGDEHHWLDRATGEPVTRKDGSSARFSSLDKAITAFIDGELTVQRNEPLVTAPVQVQSEAK